MRGSILAIGVLAACAAVASAELSQTYRSFLEGPAGFIATKDEKKSFEKLGSDAEAERFVALFWAKRNPNLGSLVNQFKVDFDLRVAAADRQFGTDRVKGSMTDRGRTLIVLGRPFGVSSHISDNTVPFSGKNVADQHGGIEVWTYRRNQIPESVKSEEVYFIFVESSVGAKDFPLDREERRNALALKLLADSPERLLRNPDLKEVPRVGLIAGSKTATVAELAMLDAQPRPWPEGARIRAAQGAQSASLFPLWIHVHLPEAVPQATRVVGRALSSDGKDAGSFAAPATALAVTGGRAYELSLPLGPGTWKVDLALLGPTAPVAVTTVDAQLEPVPDQGGWLSPTYWGVDVRKETGAAVGDPFNIGGWHVLPQPADRYGRQDTLSFFCIAVRPGMPATQKPAVETTMAVYRDGKKLGETDLGAFELSQVKGDVWMFGSSVALEALPVAGEYRLDVTVRDTTSSVRRTTSIPVTLTAP